MWETIKTASEIVLSLFIVAGAFISLLSAIGVIRFADVYLRSHAATKSATLGVLIIVTSVFLAEWIINGHFSMKLILGIIFVFLTSPVAGHLNGRAAYRSGVPLWGKSVRDDWKGSKEGQKKI
ncbi:MULTISPECIES: monovalent cation/H(+) antiporter subunit G [unclassified Paenibacillus]|uniref:monovalent cation/H(+) antiporter subunit G n=1 Tax=unclassified Paenibacillus TaxID=185978 RepID=UPI002F3F347B